MKERCGTFSQSFLTSSCILSYLLIIQLFLTSARGAINNHFTIIENSRPDTFVGIIEPLANHSFYKFDNDTTVLTYFNLNSKTSEIRTKLPIDRESLSTLKENQLHVLVLAQISASTNEAIEISIEILDVNDNDPVFPKENITITFRENVPIGSSQYLLTAIDKDYGNNSLIQQYKIINDNGPFQLVYNASMYGEVLLIVTAGKLDRENQSSYVLKIIAIDGGSPPRTGTATVFIQIEDENDNAPYFDHSEYHAQVNETENAGTFVIQVLARDLDYGVNAEVTYQITDKNLYSDQFIIESNTGTVVTAHQPLVCPNPYCILTIEARDGGTPSYTGRARIYISVIDYNNNDPEIKFKYVPDGNTQFSNIYEDAKNGDIAAGITTSDADKGIYGQTSARIIAGNEMQHFRFDLYTPGLYVVRVNGDGIIDRERFPIYNLTIEARDGGDPPRTSTKSLLIYINDINDHAPVFINNKMKLSISENTKVGSFIASMLANDSDSGLNAKLIYSIESGNDQAWFHIDNHTGLITTIAVLHFEIQHSFHMNITVQDSAARPLKNYAELEITIWDENDMAPKFTYEIFNVSLEENVPADTLIVSVAAEDHDFGPNGTLVYQLHPHTEEKYPKTFYIDVSRGDVKTVKSLDREVIAQYIFQILAKDIGPAPLTSTAVVVLKVIDVNDNSPIFYPNMYYAKVNDGQGASMEVIKVTATDADEEENAVISFSFSSTDFQKFSINSTSGIITTTAVLQKSIRSNYSLTVLAKDKFSQRSSTAIIQVIVITWTDQLPVFTNNSYSFEILEDPGNNAINIGDDVGSISARSNNSTAKINYIIANGDKSEIFSINNVTGLISRSKLIDREKNPQFVLKVVASIGDQFAEADVVITIRDLNDNAPVFEYSYIDIELVENWPVGHLLALITATDADEKGPNSNLMYSLQYNQDNIFGIVSDTGILYLNKSLKKLSMDGVNLTVLAVDSGTNHMPASQELRLKVLHVNKHTPTFSRTTYEISIIESSSVNSRFLNICATDDDIGDNGDILYTITRGNEDGQFGIFPDGFLYISEELDRETKDLYKLSVVAQDRGMPPRSSECNITICISDFNDNRPIFLNATYNFKVFENKPAGTFVGHVNATDNDMGRNADVTYFFMNYQDNMKIDPQTGEITTSLSFDREALDNSSAVKFDVLATDNGLKRLSSLITVRVIILDENDNVPQFSKLVYSVVIPENAPRFSDVVAVQAVDADLGINSIVTYSIIAGNEDGNFVIDQTTGQITVDKLLDREIVESYQLIVLGIDSGQFVKHNATAIVKITLSDINDNFPLFAQSQMDIAVSEDKELGVMVASFHATDTDLGINSEITYSLSGIDADGTFVIDGYTGIIYLLKFLDFDKKPSYSLNITARDHGVSPLSYYIRFSITVEDVNDNVPLFKNVSREVFIVENFVGSVIQVVADDADSTKNGEVQYSIAFQEPMGNNFRILKNTGLIYTVTDSQIDREIVDRYFLTVVATDQAMDISKRLSSETVVQIVVNDTNDNDPVVTSFDAISVPLATPKNTIITKVTAEDKDIGSNGMFDLQLLQNGTSYFSLDSTSRSFVLTDVLPTSPVKYTVIIQATDYGTNRRTTLFPITVLVTGNSQLLQTYNITIMENTTITTSILNVSRTNSMLEYYVTNITSSFSKKQTRLFKIDKNTGVLSAAQVLDRETMGQAFDVEIYAITPSGISPNTNIIMVHIELQDVNDTPPKFSHNVYKMDVNESVPVGFTIVKISVYDEDSIGGLQLTMTQLSDNATVANLKMNQDGTITTTGLLDRETTSQYTLRVVAFDGVQSSSCVVRINIVDVNDNSPAFAEKFYTFDISEDTVIGTTVGGIRATDPDQGAGGMVRYALSGWGNKTFHLDPVNGLFSLTTVIDFEQNQLYTLVVNAYDGGEPVLSDTVTVYFNVKDSNDNTPWFEQGTYDIAIFENVDVGKSVLQVQAHDLDSGANGLITYNITDGNIQGHFQINPKNGFIYTKASLDREITPNYTLIVMATDNLVNLTRKSSTTEVLIALKDVNDYTPVFVSPASIGVVENRPPYTVVHTVMVRDLDEGINGQVEFSAGSSIGPFSLGIDDGKIRVVGDIDRESTQNYTVVIVVRDKGMPSLSATQSLFIKVEDINDNSPIFNPVSYNITVPESSPIGDTYLQISATDQDAGLNGTVSYFIISGDDNNDFSLDQSSGIFRVSKSLDYERVQQYLLNVQASDSGKDTRSTTAAVTINIKDVNDNAPMFVDSPYIGYIRENMNAFPVPVLQVFAQNADSNQYNKLNYEIREGNKDLFSINASTGDIVALRTMDREITSEYGLTVVATDPLNGRGLTGSCTVTIYVEDMNDNAPTFDQNGTYIAHVKENSKENTEVIIIKATDLDEGANAKIIYSLKDNFQNKFKIYADNGLITTTVQLDREETSNYRLQVVAMDASMQPVSTMTTVSVLVDDVNDNHPLFKQQSYLRTMQSVSTGTFVLGVSATDQDIGLNGLVRYGLAQQDFAMFTIDGKTGVITVKQTLTNSRMYSFLVVATDQGIPALNSSVPVSVNVSDNLVATSPTFNIQSNVRILENSNLQTNVTIVMVTSPNNVIWIYNIIGGNIGDAFGISNTTGRIFVTGGVDYEVTHEYHLWIEAKQSGSTTPGGCVELVIGIDDVNDNDPVFNQTLYNVSIVENIAFGASVVTILATDADSGNNGVVTYTLSGLDSAKFTIGPKSGLISTFFTPFDRESVDVYNFIIIAQDGGNVSRASTASLRINILDYNDNPPVFTHQFRVTIPEDTKVGSFVIRVTSSDKDIGQNAIAIYNLIDDANGVFMINSISGNITLRQPLDAENKTSYKLRVSVTDTSRITEGNVEITVGDVNDNAPIIVSPINFSFLENQLPDTFVCQLAATDADVTAPNNLVYFSVKFATKFFKLDSNSGNITSLEKLTFEPVIGLSYLPNRYELIVIVTDLGTPAKSSERIIYINILDANDHEPKFELNFYRSAVPESSLQGTSILTVHAVDAYDSGQNAQIEYSLAGGNGSALFSIDKISGVISVAKPLSGFQNYRYVITIKAKDNGTIPKSSTTDVQLIITVDNNYAPQFLPVSTQTAVIENTAIGTLVQTFNATDNDTGLNAEIRYLIVNGNDNNVFYISDKNGSLFVNGMLDYEVKTQYNLTIIAKDSALYSKQAPLIYVVDLKDINDNDPTFDQAEDIAFVKENSPLGTTVYHAAAVDIDSGVNKEITYILYKDSASLEQSAFQIDNKTGVVKTKGVMDYETTDTYTLTIMAMNPDSIHKGTMKLTVYIEGVNEYVPRFVQHAYYYNISESATLNTSVGFVSATDLDKGQDSIVYYFFIGDSNTKGFKIDVRRGVIYVSGKPDYESLPSIILNVLVKNWGSVKGNDTDSCTVQISVQDANDPPTFLQAVYQSHIPENSYGNVSIIYVSATDNDIALVDRTFTYTILRGNIGGLFKIDGQTGYLSTSGVGVFDREAVPIYSIIVGAVDTGSPPGTGSATVQVYLDDVNDNGPVFLNFIANVTEGQQVSTLVTNLTVYTTDPDGPANQDPYMYNKLPGIHLAYDYFDINTDGVVRTLKILDRETIAMFIIPVIVTDNGTPKMSSTLSFSVSVLDINDTPPKPRFMEIFLSVYDGKYPTQVIANVRPIDLDLDPASAYKCNLTTTTDLPFVMKPNSCDLMLNSYPTQSSYTLQVYGNDGVFSAVQYEVVVKILNFDSITLDYTTIIQIDTITGAMFVESVCSKFVSAMKDIFGQQYNIMIFRIDESSKLLIYFAVKQIGSATYYNLNTLRQKLTDAKSSIQLTTGVSILNVAYSPCPSTQCQNAGVCASHITMATTIQITDTTYQVFSNPTLNLVPFCRCPVQFTGPDCSQPASQCGSTYCKNGGNCSTNVCQCPVTWTGSSCENDVNECEKSKCYNNAECENIVGSFICHCPNGFSGNLCQYGNDSCQSNPCESRATCQNTFDGYFCACPYGFSGNKCQYSSMGFRESAFLEFPTMKAFDGIEVIFATLKKNSLLLYNPSSLDTNNFIALEILNGKMRFSISAGFGNATRLTVDSVVNTGSWFVVRVTRSVQTIRMWVAKCPDDARPCDTCQTGTSCYADDQLPGSLDFGTHPLLIGGVKTIDTILNRTGQVATHDFVGCVRSFIINGQDKLGESPSNKSGTDKTCPRSGIKDRCEDFECKNGGVCIDNWDRAQCICTSNFQGQHCETALNSVGISQGAMIKITPLEGPRLDALLELAGSARMRREIAESSVKVRFRIWSNDLAVLVSASTFRNSYCILSVSGSQLNFTLFQNGGFKFASVVASSTLTDGLWHNATVIVTATEVTLILDASISNTPMTGFLFTSSDVREIILGSTSSSISRNNKDFDGCVSVFELNGKEMPLNGTTEKYTIIAGSGVENKCSKLCENQCSGKMCIVTEEAFECQRTPAGLSVGIIAMIVILVVLLMVIIVVFVLFRYQRIRCLKAKDILKQNGTTLCKSVNISGHSNPDSGYGETNIDDIINRNHIAQELAGSSFDRHNGHFMKPDIIKSDIGRTPLSLQMEDGTVIIDNASEVTHLRDLDGDMPEHYDLENASSIAPSDIDVVDHYKRFHYGQKSRIKEKGHTHNSKNSSKNVHNLNSYRTSYSPNLVNGVPFKNDQVRISPNARSSPLNQLSRQSPNVRQSPLTHINMHGMPVTDLSGGGGSRTTSEHSLASHRSKTSCSTPNKPKRQMLPNGHAVKNHNYENNKFLTLEEVEKLNARPRESPASLVEAFSTSSENNTRKMLKPYPHYKETNNCLEPPDSSSDDSTNDSFTCSEFEFDNDKPRNDFDHKRIFSKVPEVDNENEDGGYHNKLFTPDGLNSVGNSFSSTEQTSDHNRYQGKLPSNAFNWDDLLNWGPKFEKLVGVFTDIALLPDANSMEFNDRASKPGETEEYV